MSAISADRNRATKILGRTDRGKIMIRSERGIATRIDDPLKKAPLGFLQARAAALESRKLRPAGNADQQ
jgi:hypothetical protein